MKPNIKITTCCLPYVFVVLIAILCTRIIVPAYAENPYDNRDPNQVTMTWEEFKKLLKIDSDEIELSWDEFYKLLSLTGGEINPVYNIQNGKVILQRDQFKKLLEAMKPPRVTTLNPPGDYLITKATYSGIMDQKSITFHGQFFIEIFEKERDVYPKIQLLPKDVAIREIRIDNKPGLVMIENGWYVLTTNKTGQHVVDVQFSLKSDLDKGPAILDLIIPETAITLFKLDIPLKNVQVEIPQGKYMAITKVNGQTKIDAVLSTTNRINVKVHHISPGDIAKNNEPAKIYVETMNLLSIEDDLLRATTKFNVDILQNTITDIKMYVPEGYSILYVRDQNFQEIRDWTIKHENNRELLTVPFGGQKIGRVVFTVIAEKIFTKEDDVNYHGFEVLKAVRETGYIGVEKKSAAEAEIASVDNIDRIDIQRLPTDLVNISTRPLLFALRYLKHPFNLVLAITKHDELPVVNTVIDNASIVSVFLEDGKIITRVVYKMRNTGKQFLQLTLPSGAEIWSLYVDGNRELPSINAQGSFMIPLVLSKIENGNIAPFDVEIVYYTKNKGFAVIGSKRLPIPKTDVIISRILLSCYLPVDYRFVYFGGNVEKEKIASGLNPLFGVSRVFTYDEVSEYNRALASWEKGPSEPTDKDVKKLQNLLKSEFKTSAHNELGAVTDQLRQEINFTENIQREREHGSIGTPLLRIDIPTSGQLYRFAKTLVEGEDLYVDFQYLKGWVSTIINIAIVIFVVLVIYLLRSYVKKVYCLTKEWLLLHKNLWAKAKTPQGTRVILGVGAIVFLFLSKVLFVIFVLLFLLAWLKPEWIFRRQQKTPSQT